jgi:hypothetical protein
VKLRLAKLESRLHSGTQPSAAALAPPNRTSDSQSEVHDSDTEDAALVLEELALGKGTCAPAPPHMVIHILSRYSSV